MHPHNCGHDHDVNSSLVLAEQQCKDKGARLTPKRKQVLSVLLKSDKALSAYDIIDRYKDDFGEAPPAMSIYRILEFLESEHLVHKLQLANKFVSCSHITCCESHEDSIFFICSTCNKVEEAVIKPATFEELKNSGSAAGFKLDSPQLEINCICTQCSLSA
ncbi:Fur family transcriptional regulator [Reinekea marina]|uniref:Fur family transcriptional regulator n=2 Tax=Reinekea marina TaxID=1310421 RepID=A0ABV7WM82_9GAMM